MRAQGNFHFSFQLLIAATAWLWSKEGRESWGKRKRPCRSLPLKEFLERVHWKQRCTVYVRWCWSVVGFSHSTWIYAPPSFTHIKIICSQACEVLALGHVPCRVVPRRWGWEDVAEESHGEIAPWSPEVSPQLHTGRLTEFPEVYCSFPAIERMNCQHHHDTFKTNHLVNLIIFK